MIAVPTALAAQERAVDGTLGAVAGAVVFGPLGLVAGGGGRCDGGAWHRVKLGFATPSHYRRVRYVRHEH
ncbi:MAG: hypothetical protein WDN29_00780 [Methylovirgula sp.]